MTERMTACVKEFRLVADALRLRIQERFAWQCNVPDYVESATLP